MQRPTAGRLLPLLGPAIVAGVAYLDPGNVASNMTAGAAYGYLLIWVVVAANAMAWLIQYLSAKLGIATGASLPQNLGRRIKRRPLRFAYWVQAELVAMATDVAEILGGAIALNLLFGLPLLAGGIITGGVSLILLALHTHRGGRVFEGVIAGLVLIIGIGFCAGIVIGPPDPAAALAGLVPRFQDSGSVLLAASILGATVMPHAIYAHSSLSRDKFAGLDPVSSRPILLKATRIDVTIALTVAGGINVVILLVAAASLQGVPGTDTLEGAYTALASGLGPAVATLFAIGLLASGLASSSVGAFAGSEIMRGLLHINVPLLARRIITIIPALLVLIAGVEPTQALLLSQVVLSFGIPFALVPLIWLTSRRAVVGDVANKWWTTVLATVAGVLLVALNITLIVLLVSGN
ncbi:Nramp family divalent metal transporter [Amnibacterium flavum]|uniref:Nramp family divalent metal transporter n=1 Tax=Amnibacterium flavum TaxID=2173173 RepID=UPI001F0B7DF1|nr:Nramp family divalent metal transporter [Amnibacterium flavum]